MPSSHTITTRPATEDELVALGVRADTRPITTGCLVIVAYALPVTFLVLLIASTIGSGGPPSALDVILKLVGLALATWFALFVVRGLRKDRGGVLAFAREELEAGVVEEIEVRTDRVVLFQPYGGVDFGLAVDIGQEHTLVLSSWALIDDTIYDANEWGADERSPEAMRLPFAFPTNRFTIVRSPLTGYLLSIRTNGPFIRPIESVLPSLQADEHIDALLLNRSLDGLLAPIED